MSKKKKKKKEGLFSNLDPNVKKIIWAVCFLALGIFLTLALFNFAGDIGKFLNQGFSRTFGFGRFVFPIGLFILAIMYFKRLEGKKVYLSLWIGLVLMKFGVLGLLHIFNDPDKMEKIAKNGEGGGYLGFFLASFLHNLVGVYAGAVILFFLLIIGVLITFNSYIAKILSESEDEEEDESEGDELIREDKDKDKIIKKEKQNSRAVAKEEKIHLFSKIKKAFLKDSDENSLKSKNLNKKEETGLEAKESANLIQKEEDKNKSPWILPPLSLLEKRFSKPEAGDVKHNALVIENALQNFGIEVEVAEINVGPTVTQYALKPAEGVRLSKIVALQNDLSLALSAHPLRIDAPIPGRSLVGIEIPNKKSALVRFRNVLEKSDFFKKDGLLVVLGEDAGGNFITADISDMPHLLIAGATGAGKSIGIANIINSFLFKHSPEDLKLILVDPKRVELSSYNDVPHLLTPVIVDVDKVVNALKWTIAEMERRYRVLQECGVRDIFSYNLNIFSKQKASNFIKNSRKNQNVLPIKTMDGIGYTREPLEEKEVEVISDLPEKLPFIVVVIDELADIMVTHGKEVETLIVRIAQKARAVGIHLILSTQRPSVDVITGLIKANVPARVAYQVSSQIDSRTILDMAGAEKLLGKGDMLFAARDSSRPKRIQGAYLEEKEIKRVVDFLKKQAVADYDEDIISQRNDISVGDGAGKDLRGGGSASGGDFSDDLFEIARQTVIEHQKASATFLQRRLRVGYARAARLMEMLEEDGVIGPTQGAKPREILIKQGGEIEYKDDLVDQEKRDKWEN